MKPGRLDRLVTIQRHSTTPSDSGEPVETWAVVGALRQYASMAPVRGEERFVRSDQRVGLDQIEFIIRYSSDVAELEPKDRVIYPALEASSDTPTTRAIYDILAVHEVGRRQGLRIITERRADVT